MYCLQSLSWGYGSGYRGEDTYPNGDMLSLLQSENNSVLIYLFYLLKCMFDTITSNAPNASKKKCHDANKYNGRNSTQ